jgi:uncharacterized protein YijF (DUF1287 family)
MKRRHAATAFLGLFMLMALGFCVCCEQGARVARGAESSSEQPVPARAQPPSGYSGAPVWKPATDRDTFLYNLSLAAIERTRHEVEYDPAYMVLDYPGGDVPDNKGVCADVVVRAYRALGIDLQVDVHQDMKANFSRYPNRWGLKRPDKNIDHRRVLNLMTLFSRKGTVLPVTDNPADYLPGHIVSWDLNGKGLTHIGIVTHVRGSGGRFKIVHNIGRGPHLEDVLFDWKIIGHHTYFGDKKFNAEGKRIP